MEHIQNAGNNLNSTQTENCIERIKTDHFEIIYDSTDKSNVPLVDILLNGNRLPAFNDETIIVHVSDAYDIPMKEFEQIDFAIQIHSGKDKTFTGAEGPHVRTIIYTAEDGTEVAIIVFGPEDNFFDQNLPNEQYLTAIKELVKNDPRLILNPIYETENNLDIDSQIELINAGANYSTIGPFEFYVKLKAGTFGELALQLDQLMYELEEKAKLYF